MLVVGPICGPESGTEPLCGGDTHGVHIDDVEFSGIDDVVVALLVKITPEVGLARQTTHCSEVYDGAGGADTVDFVGAVDGAVDVAIIIVKADGVESVVRGDDGVEGVGLAAGIEAVDGLAL